MLDKDVGIIIPAYNEEERLGQTLETLKKIHIIEDILVVNDGSSDRTGEIAQEKGIKLISFHRNRGKGYALKTGIDYLDNSIIVFLDADIGETAGEVVKLIYPLLEGRAEVTIGKIGFTPGKGGFGMVKRLSQRAFKSLTGKECTSLLSGQRAFKREVLDKELLNYRRYGIEFGMTVDLVQRNLRILEVPIDIRHRITGKDYRGFVHRGKQFWDILMVVVKKKVEASILRRQTNV